ncbi:hypothetical protein VP01_2508g4 [Puccinia sorghi]|uniref:Uncharacterized protein n=1 Tax=Puccinia sorghi TaxID=27349 RepID=A0A0L6V5H8_9BASI|nr:hypothetical protein VP01_2508g4 [Puccinia sorghi]
MAPSDESQSIWEILDALEEKLIHSINQNTQLILPQIIEKSNQLIQTIPADLLQIYNPFTTSNSNNIITNKDIVLSHGIAAPTAIDLSSTNKYTSKLFRPRNLLITSGVLLSSTLAVRSLVQTSYYEEFVRSHPTLLQYLPRLLRPTSRRRRRKDRRQGHSTEEGDMAAPELLVVLGADPGTAGHQLALHLAQLGYAVIASVSDAEMVSGLELEGLGWLKPLVLDPMEPQTSAFTRALAASLRIRFPLSRSIPGTVFHTTIHQPALVGLINCLPISLPDLLRPVEALAVHDHLIARIHAVVGVSLDVIKIVLPIMRNSIEKFGAEDGLILTLCKYSLKTHLTSRSLIKKTDCFLFLWLVPTKNSSLALPYLGSSLVANQALESLMVTLRREMRISDSGSGSRIRVVNERIGTFRPVQNYRNESRGETASLPVHLHGIYARSMSRRMGLVGLPTTGCLPTTGLQGSPLSQLMRRVEKIVEGRRVGTGSRTAVGAETWRYMLVDRLVPPSWVDRWLALVERLNGWVRAKVISEVDLECQENLERMVEKRQFSAQSHWKNSLFVDGNLAVFPEGEIEFVMDHPLPPPDNPSPVAPDPPVEPADSPDDIRVETGSVIDHGPQHDDPPSAIPNDEQEALQDSFVGSEIDWKEKSNA